MAKRSLATLRRQANQARTFPTNTCPASRHVHEMADVLAHGGTYAMFAEEPKYCAESLLSVLIELWLLRSEKKKVEARQESARVSRGRGRDRAGGDV